MGEYDGMATMVFRIYSTIGVSILLILLAIAFFLGRCSL